MEAVLVPYSSDHYRHHRQQPIVPHKQMRNNMSNIHGGLLMAPPSLSYSYPPLANPFFNHPQQPPLLPLPISRPYSSLPCRSRSRAPSSSPKSSKIGRDQSLTPKKQPKQAMKRKEDLKQTTQDLPKSVSRTMTGSNGVVGGGRDLEKFPDSVFTLSPPPSSLPLPKFPLRPKLGCKAEAAAGVDAGATDNLRRMLRLR